MIILPRWIIRIMNNVNNVKIIMDYRRLPREHVLLNSADVAGSSLEARKASARAENMMIQQHCIPALSKNPSKLGVKLPVR